jgi:hypothetical protein
MMKWFKMHINWTWVSFYLLILVVAFSAEVYVNINPPTKFTTNTTYTDLSVTDMYGNGETLHMPKPTLEKVVDEKALQSQYLWVGLLWFWPIYLIGTYKVSKWALIQKGRNLDWLWLTMLLFVFTPLLLSNRSIQQSVDTDSNLA